MSEDSLRAAEAALWAKDQGKFLEYETALFTAWLENGSDAYSTEELMKMAGLLSLDKEALKRSLDIGVKKAELDKNMNMAKTDHVTTLPAVLIDGTKIEGFKPLDTYVQLIQQALKKRGL